MKFKKNTRRRAIEYEKDLVNYWKVNKTFEKSVAQRPADSAYVFYDGPPFITGVPHHGTLLSSIIKDAVPRYQTMKGHRVERVWGWDCHGLPAEVFTEKKLGIADKRDIGTKITLEDYIVTCRTNMVTTGDLWEDTIDRIGRWVDFKGAYKTMDKEFMESVWWAFKELWGKGKIYEGEKVLLYCTRDATPISKAEVAMDNSYQDVTDPSVYVKFKLTNESVAKLHEMSVDPKIEEINLLAWTTTPWTLNANTALVINRDVMYHLVTIDGSNLLVAEAALDKVLKDEKRQPLSFERRAVVEGSWLEGLEYEPLFVDRGKNAHKVWHADFVTDQDGTGIAHQAPGYGEDDYLFAKANKVPFVLDTDEEGFYTEGPWQGKQIWEHNKQIAKDLKEQGVVWKIEYIRHEYPHCHRCGTKLQYRAHPSWFMDVDGQRQEMLEQNGNITWFPEHIKHGRFEKTVESAPDWNLSRDRFWATAMPVWKGTDKQGNTKDKDGNEYIKVIGSYAELKELSGVELEDYHRPWIDDVTFTIDSVTYKRIDKVMDCWFESGSMPFAQFHYPFENKEKFEANFPGDFIAEYVGQVRAWFYYLHAVNVGLFGKNAFKNVVVTGTLAGNDGRKMSKSFGNYTDPNELMDKFSADALRFLLLASPVIAGEDFSLLDKDVNDVNRKLAMVWNMYDFFTLYADVDGWEWKGELGDPSSECTNPLDVWIVSRMHQLISEVTTHMDRYDLQNALKPILPFIDDASNWYVRRSRKRFWKAQDDGDKAMAYRTLHYVLVKLAHVLAPFTPFMAEELYRNLTGGESVHLQDWPVVGHVNELVIRDMARTRHVITDGLSQRAEHKLKVRQPLASVTVYGVYDLDMDLQEVIAEELNVKKVILAPQQHFADPEKSIAETAVEAINGFPLGTVGIELDTSVTPELRREGMMREVIRAVQNARKEAGLEVDDRISLHLHTADKELQQAITEHTGTISSEVLAEKLTEKLNTASFAKEVSVEGIQLTIGIERL